MKGMQRAHHSRSTVSHKVVLLSSEEAQWDAEHSTDLCWVWGGAKSFIYEANNGGHQQTALQKIKQVCFLSVY